MNSALLKLSLIIMAVMAILDSCSNPKSEVHQFLLLDSTRTGIGFCNTIKEDTLINIAFYAYMYNGGGVGIGDVNNDGLEDIYFTGNQVSSRLYLNQGNLKFKDITQLAGVSTDIWATGVSLVDINADGWTDIYVSATATGDGRSGHNKLFVNNGVDEFGAVSFSDRTSEFNVDDDGFTVQAAFFDFDLDGDLDVYMLRNHLEEFPQNTLRPILNNGSDPSTDKLLRNDSNKESGEIKFTDVSASAGILMEGYGLGITISDLNKDGWPDIYVGNDFISHDLVYINNQNETFTDQSLNLLKHQSRHSMGVDIADYNNDGLSDIIVLDMLPQSNSREKQMASFVSYDYFTEMEKEGYGRQYVRNTLQLNNGYNGKGKLSFSEIGQLANIFKTDWSWSPLFADFDNDGLKDLFISNGILHDVTDLDYINYGANEYTNIKARSRATILQSINTLPEIKIPNFMYSNNGDLTFTDRTDDWGFQRPSLSQGVAYADLDNDGDLDLVINNINEAAFVYENKSKGNNYLQVSLMGSRSNSAGIGAKIYVANGEQYQYAEQYQQRGFQSSVGSILHFGLGKDSVVQNIKVVWPDGKESRIQNIEANQRIQVDWKYAKLPLDTSKNTRKTPIFSEPTFQQIPSYCHKAYPFIDFYSERLIPQLYSMNGPGMAVGDVDGNGLEDFIIGADCKSSATLFFQTSHGIFKTKELINEKDLMEGYDQGLLLFDSDNDNDLDLYIASGGSRLLAGDTAYIDKLYINDGNGNFSYQPQLLPEIAISSSSVSAADYDQDGDLDLFVAAKIVPRQFPRYPASYILRNDAGIFVEAKHLLPNDGNIGRVSQALWTDFDNDGLIDILIAGEWMPLQFYRNTGDRFEDLTLESGISEYSGWWNSLTGADFDNDGDIDYIAGNLGNNNKLNPKLSQPVQIFVNDFDRNGTMDPIMSYYSQDAQVPVARRDLAISQVPFLKKRFPDYSSYAKATIKDILTPEEIAHARVFQGSYAANSYIENKGNGKFMIYPLPILSQFSSMNGVLVNDFNEDGNLDLLFCGNNYSPDVLTGAYDASYGGLLLGDGNGHFKFLNHQSSGFFVDGNAKALSMLPIAANVHLIVASQNGDFTKYFTVKVNTQTIPLRSLDASAEIKLKDGKRRKIEFYYGEGYLSQQSRNLIIPQKSESIKVKSFDGNSYEVKE